MHMTLRQLEMIVAIAENRGLSRAARAMNVAQPSLTRSLRELETALGVALFERTPRGMAPTSFGEVLVRRGKSIQAELRSAEDELDSLNGGAAGRVIVGVTLLGAATIVPKAIVSFAAEWPKTTVIVYDGQDNKALAARLLSGDLDFAVRPLREEGPEEGLTEDFLFNSELQVWARGLHPLAKKRRIALSDLQAFPWILPPKHVRPRRQFENAFIQQDLVPPSATVETSSLPAIHAMLLDADWLTLLPSHVFASDAQNGQIIRLPVSLPGAWRAIGIARRAGSTILPAARALSVQIKRVVRELERTAHRPP